MRPRTRKSGATGNGSQDGTGSETSQKTSAVAPVTIEASSGTAPKQSETNVGATSQSVSMDSQSRAISTTVADTSSRHSDKMDVTGAASTHYVPERREDKHTEAGSRMEDEKATNTADARLQRKRKMDQFVLSDDEGESTAKKQKPDSQSSVAKEQKTSPHEAAVQQLQQEALEQKRKAQSATAATPAAGAPGPAASSAKSHGGSSKPTEDVKKKDEGWDPMDWMKAAAQVVRAPFRPADKSAKESIEGAITKALGGTRKGYYRGVDLALDGVLSDDVNNYFNGFCSALSKGLNAKWYACGRYARAGEQTYNRCSDHPSAAPAMRLCLKNVRARDLNSKDGTIREITLVYPELLFSLVGKEVYRRCDDALGSLDPDVRQQGLQELQTALYNSTAFTTGFACSVSLGWKGGAPGEGKLQGIFVRPADPKHVEVTNPGAGWQIVPKKDHTVYAYQVEEQTWGPTPSNQPAPGAVMAH